MLHGHTKIELNNVKTGEKKVIEHDNYMTNWLRDILTPDMYGNNILATDIFSNRPDFSKAMLFGGVVLFEDELSSGDADDYLFPLNNKMIAHGGNEAYAGSDLTMGSFNSGLSVISDDEATFIWDFTQERGNGTISALGLTNIYGGKAGSGHGKNAADVNVTMSLFRKRVWETSGGINYRYAFFDPANNKAYFIKTSALESGKIKYREAAYNNTQYNPITEWLDWSRVGVYSNGEEKEINVSSYFSSFPSFTIYNGKMYMCESSNWTGGNRTFVVFDFSAGTLTTQTVTNATGKTLVSAGGHAFEIWNNRIYFVSTDSRRVYIDLTDNTDCGVVKNPDNEEIESTGEFVSMWGNLFFADTSEDWTLNENKTQIWCMTSKDHASRRNISGLQLQNNYDGPRPAFGGNKAVGYYTQSYGYNSIVIHTAIYNFMALQTKNNLDSPVTKTSDMTMRVTYTIREAT